MTTMLSADAQALLRDCVTSRNPSVDDHNREAYRELANAGIMYPVSGFLNGPEALYRFTEEGWLRRHELVNAPASVSQRRQ